MDRELLNKLSKRQLEEIATDLGLSPIKKENKNDLLIRMMKCLDEHENMMKEHFKDYSEKYTVLKQIGNTGSQGVTYLVKNKETGEFMAMKTFATNKSKNRLQKEAELQQIASSVDIAPKIFDVNLEKKYIVMELMDRHLYDVMKMQEGNLTEEQQRSILNIFKKLDECHVLHGDVNILNYMYRNTGELAIIDFGMSKLVDKTLEKKLNTKQPNYDLMTLAFVLKLKDLKCPETSYSYLINFIPDETKNKYGL